MRDHHAGRLVLLMALAALLVPIAGNAQVLGTVAGTSRMRPARSCPA